jgi:hypothetical protein
VAVQAHGGGHADDDSAVGGIFAVEGLHCTATLLPAPAAAQVKTRSWFVGAGPAYGWLSLMEGDPYRGEHMLIGPVNHS